MQKTANVVGSGALKPLLYFKAIIPDTSVNMLPIRNIQAIEVGVMRKPLKLNGVTSLRRWL
jgi:hypothetical protein